MVFVDGIKDDERPAHNPIGAKADDFHGCALSSMILLFNVEEMALPHALLYRLNRSWRSAPIQAEEPEHIRKVPDLSWT